MINVVYSEAYQDQAATKIRIIEPLLWLNRKPGFNSISIQRVIKKYQDKGSFPLDNEDFRNAHILYLFITDINQTNVNEMSAIINFFLSTGKAVISNLDDHYFKIPNSITVKQPLDQNASLFESLVKASSLVMVTGDQLKDEISLINSNVIAVPNMIDPNQYPLRPGGNKKIRIGWCGLPSHFADLVMVLQAIKKVMQKYPVELVLFGLFTEDMKKTFATAQKLAARNLDIKKQSLEGHFISDAIQLAKALAGINYTHAPLVSYGDYPHTLAKLNFDIGICPLVDNLFNRCKSAIKFAQYAAVGTVTLASDIYPYSKECNYRAQNTTDDWYNKLAALVENESLRSSLLHEQQSYILENRNYEKGIALYEAIFKQLAGQS
jgi:glycosyltransferase involved in cell wall biosynthesis